MTVRGHVDTENHTSEVNVHARVKATHKAATTLTKVCTKAVEQNQKGRDMKDITDQKTLIIQGDDGRAPPKDGSIRVVAHPNPKRANRHVRDESRMVEEHMVSCTGVRNDETMQISGGDSPEESGDQFRREDDVVTRSHRVRSNTTLDRPNGVTQKREGNMTGNKEKRNH